MTIAEKTLLLKQDFDDVKQAGRFNPIISSENLNGNVSGTVIAVNDVVDMSHNVSVKLSSKNLCSNIYSEYEKGSTYSSLYIANEPLIMSFVDKDTSVDISGCYIGFAVNPNNANEGYRWVINNGTVQSSKHNSATQNGNRCSYVFVYPNDENTFNKLMQRFYIQVEIGTTATEYTPYVADVGGIEVSRYGKNLFDSSQLLAADGWTETDGVYSGLPQALYRIYNPSTSNISLFNGFKSNTQYTISFKGYSDDENTVGARPLTFRFMYSDDTFTDVWIRNNVEKTYTLTSTADKTVVGLYVSYGKNSMCYVWDIQLELSTIATDYEAYIEPTTYQSTADGTVEGVTSIAPNMTLLSDNNGVVINAHYYKDPDIVISNLQQSVALSGGE